MPGAPDQTALATLSEPGRAEALRRWEVLRAHLEDGVPLTRVTAQSEIPHRTLQRWLARYRAGGLAGLGRAARADRGRSRFPEPLRLLVEGLALRTPVPSAAHVHRQVTAVAEREGWPVPSYSSVYAIIRGIDPAMATLAHEGSKRYKEVFDLVHRREAAKPNEIYLNAQAEHLLDWFHLTMRITVMANMAKSLPLPLPGPEFPDGPPTDLANEIGTQLQRLKWFCWHGNVFRALQTVDDLIFDLDTAQAAPIEQVRLLKAVREFDAYLRANAGRIPDYGERYRAGEAISTAFTESAVNQVISKRMVKKQQMRWTPRCAHLLLQVRTRVLNDQLASDFYRWYPGLRRMPDPLALAA